MELRQCRRAFVNGASVSAIRVGSDSSACRFRIKNPHPASHNPAQYGLSLSWQHGKWAAECCVENFLDRRMVTRTNANYGVYQSVSESLSDLKGRNISVSVTYTLPYGKKTDRDRIETESKINSAILRPF